jgi:UDP-N-acetylmuramyl tripeptide synthase
LINADYYDFGNAVEAAELATPEPCDLYHMLHRMEQSNRYSVVMEVSTHGLLRRRVQSLGMHVLAYTGHVYDPKHKDEWGDVLPLKLDAFLRGWDRCVPDIAVINRDDNQAEQLLASLPTCVDSVTYGLCANADIRAERPRRTPLGWKFTLAWEGGRVDTLYAQTSLNDLVLGGSRSKSISL